MTLALLAAPAPAAAVTLETAVKAAFLYKFGAFVEWPPRSFAGPGEPARLCIAGTDPFGGALDQLVKGQQIAGRAIVVVRLQAVDKDSGCQILFAGGAPKQPVAEELAKVQGEPVLTVTDAAQDPLGQGIINFLLRNDRVRFQINDQAAARVGISISSKLLDLAVKSGSAP